MKRKFNILASIRLEMEVEDDVIQGIDDEWCSVFYKLNTEKDVIKHLAFNLMQGRRLSILDGFADREDSDARIEVEDFFDLEIEEIANPPTDGEV